MKKNMILSAAIVAVVVIVVIVILLTQQKNPIVTVEMENGDIIKIELYSRKAPNTVNNFISLIEQGYYDGLTFHRIVEGFVIQGGDPLGDGTGGPGYSIKGEFSANDFKNNIKHEKGVISMARSQHPDSAGSQFFICVEDAASLDGIYASFGKVIEGMEVVEDIVFAEVIGGKNDPEYSTPVEPRVMKQLTVELFNKRYKEPEIIHY